MSWSVHGTEQSTETWVGMGSVIFERSPEAHKIQIEPTSSSPHVVESWNPKGWNGTKNVTPPLPPLFTTTQDTPRMMWDVVVRVNFLQKWPNHAKHIHHPILKRPGFCTHKLQTLTNQFKTCQNNSNILSSHPLSQYTVVAYCAYYCISYSTSP